jgi:Niemann-Pick C1 protein
MPATGSGVRTCCDTAQLKALDENLRLAEGILKRCTSCVKNLIRHICEFTCSTTQSKFVEPAELLLNPANGNNF